MALTLAIDQSTSATKALLLDGQGRILNSKSREHSQLYPRPGWVEHDAEEIWKNLQLVVADLLEESRSNTLQIDQVSVANQRETVVAFDAASGRPLHTAIVWRCRRTASLCERQISLGRDEPIRAKTGLRLDSYFSAPKLQWLMQSLPDLRPMLLRGDAKIGTMDTYLLYRMTQGSVYATDHTNACRTLLYDIDRLGWDDELCAWWEIPRQCLPEIRASDAEFGHTTLGGLLPTPVTIRGVMGDSQAALFAHRCLEPGSAKVTFGTGSSVLLNVGADRPRASRGLVSTVAWVRGTRPTYALEGIITSSAATLDWLRDQLGILGDVRESERLARSAEDDEGVYVIPAFSGMGAPYWQETAKAAIVGLTAHSDRRHIVRAALESMAYQLRDVLDLMRTECAAELRHICADGGPASNAFLMQFVADIVGVELTVATLADQAAIGAALMGRTVQDATIPAAHDSDPANRYRCAMPSQQAQRRYEGWRHAVKTVLSM